MDFRYTPEEERFRTGIRDWLAANLPGGWRTTFREPENEAERFAFRLAWEHKLHAAGWSGVAWPREHGGRGATLVEQAIFQEELAATGAPPIRSALPLPAGTGRDGGLSRERAAPDPPSAHCARAARSGRG